MVDKTSLEKVRDNAEQAAAWCQSRLNTIGESKLSESERIAVHVAHSLAMHDVATVREKIQRS